MFQPHILNQMRVKVSKVKIYNPATDEVIVSRRMATKTGADIMRGEIMPETEVLINSSQLEQGEQWTALDFAPETATA